VSRSSRRRKGRPYQPLPDKPGGAWGARLLVLAVGVLLILAVGVLLIFGSLALFAGSR
jgi:hypothetical protein